MKSSFDAVAEQRQVAAEFRNSSRHHYGSYVPPYKCWICLTLLTEQNRGQVSDICQNCEEEFPVRKK